MARASFELPKTLTKGNVKTNMNVVIKMMRIFGEAARHIFSSGAKFSQLKAACFAYSTSET